MKIYINDNISNILALINDTADFELYELKINEYKPITILENNIMIFEMDVYVSLAVDLKEDQVYTISELKELFKPAQQNISLQLYDAQETALNLLLDAFLGRGEIDKRNLMLLTGEVGSGKTYIAAKLIKEITDLKQRDVLIIIPDKRLKGKWNEVLHSAGLYDYKILTKFNADTIDEYDLIIYDEVHTIKTKIKHFDQYFEDKNKIFLGLTGSAINKYVNELSDFFNYYLARSGELDTYKDFKDSARHRYFNEADRYDYIENYLRYFYCVPINKDQIEELISDGVKINTIKHDLDMNTEERAFYKFMTHRFKALNMTKNKTIYYLNRYLDQVEHEELVISVKGENYYAGDPIVETNNIKIEKLKEILNNEKSIIVYTFDDILAKSIAHEIDNLEYVDTRLSSELKNVSSIDTINEKLKHTNVIVNVKNILLGFDIESNTAVFYQTPEDLETNVQAIGRITRLHNSMHEKTVHYLYHSNTVQEETINIIEKNNTLNNVLIGKAKDEEDEEYLQICGIPVFDTCKKRIKVENKDLLENI